MRCLRKALVGVLLLSMIICSTQGLNVQAKEKKSTIIWKSGDLEYDFNGDKTPETIAIYLVENNRSKKQKLVATVDGESVTIEEYSGVGIDEFLMRLQIRIPEINAGRMRVRFEPIDLDKTTKCTEAALIFEDTAQFANGNNFGMITGVSFVFGYDKNEYKKDSVMYLFSVNAVLEKKQSKEGTYIVFKDYYGRYDFEETALGTIEYDNRLELINYSTAEYSDNFKAPIIGYSKKHEFVANDTIRVYSKPYGSKKTGTIKIGKKFKASKLYFKGLWHKEDRVTQVFDGYEVSWAYAASTDGKVKGWIDISGRPYVMKDQYVDKEETLISGYVCIPNLVVNPLNGNKVTEYYGVERKDAETGKTIYVVEYNTPLRID